MRFVVSVLSALLTVPAALRGEPPQLQVGPWRAWLDSPGGELPFGLELAQGQGRWSAAILNGVERIEIPSVEVKDGSLMLGIPYYDSTIAATVSADGARLDGEWKRRSKGDRWVQMAFHATAGKVERFPAPTGNAGECREGSTLAGRWAIRFADDSDPAVGIFDEGAGGTVVGTILTPTGDYRYLAGVACLERVENGPLAPRLRLSAFDGAHAFLLSAVADGSDALKGDFWSGAAYHDTWTAKRDEKAELPDAFLLTKAMEAAKLEDVVFPDLEGNKRSLADPKFAGKARIIEVFGTWCPNCNDASHYLVELDKAYKDKGLSILGLAFEYSGEFARDAGQVRTFAAHHKIAYPILLAGTADRVKASASLPIIDGLRAFPTLLVLDRNNKIVATYTGFSGPATGAEYDRFRSRFEALIQKLLAD